MRRRMELMNCMGGMFRSKRRVFHFGAWACMALIALLSLVPGRVQLNTGAPGVVEHMLAYLGAGILLSLIYPRKRLLVLAVLVACSVLFEVVQAFVPGRFASRYDAAASTLGAILGVAMVALFSRLYGRRLTRRPVRHGRSERAEDARIPDAVER